MNYFYWLFTKPQLQESQPCTKKLVDIKLVVLNQTANLPQENSIFLVIWYWVWDQGESRLCLQRQTTTHSGHTPTYCNTIIQHCYIPTYIHITVTSTATTIQQMEVAQKMQCMHVVTINNNIHYTITPLPTDPLLCCWIQPTPTCR